jgi:hypothetical protein
VGDRGGSHQQALIGAGPHLPFQRPGEDVGVASQCGAGQPVPVSVEHGHGEVLAVAPDVGDVVGVDRGAVVHVTGHGDRHVAGQPHQVTPLLPRVVLEDGDPSRIPNRQVARTEASTATLMIRVRTTVISDPPLAVVGLRPAPGCSARGGAVTASVRA